MAPSLPPLRSWRSTIYAPSSQFTNVNTNASGAIESPASINHRFSLAQQQQEQSYESSVTELRRRLARKASTFSLRGKNRRSQRYLRELVRAEEKVQEAEGQQRQQQPEEDSETSSVVTAKKEGTDTTGTLPQSFTARFRNKNAPRPLRSHTITCVSMASESSPPPVPFARLEKIATEACESTLSPHPIYIHSSTASWNTSIINSILHQLVKETSTTTTDSGGQPQFKYIVNSTIIQHGDSQAGGGRRGMHAASGAYWNNEKDGMWSFKYEAAEGKGLDVVVGVIWVWIG